MPRVKIDSSNSIMFYIHRKAQLRACLIPYRIYINGSYVGDLKNNDSICVCVGKAEKYLVEEENMFSKRSIIVQPTRDTVCIEVQTEGGWSTPSHPTFYLPAENNEFPRSAYYFIHALYEGRRTPDSLSEAERVLHLCYEFWTCVSDDGALSEIVTHEKFTEMFAALRTIGAVRLVEFCEKAFREVLGDAALPIENIKQYEAPLAELDSYILRNTKHTQHGIPMTGMKAIEIELRHCAAQFLLQAEKNGTDSPDASSN